MSVHARCETRYSLPSVLIVWLALTFLQGTAWSAEGEKLAIKGYDPVAYFTKGAAERGKREFSFKWQGREWLFENREHVKLFKAAPTRYAPRYGGFCAAGVSQGFKMEPDPEQWKIVDGKLFLFFDRASLTDFAKSPKDKIKLADKHWRQLRK